MDAQPDAPEKDSAGKGLSPNQKRWAMFIFLAVNVAVVAFLLSNYPHWDVGLSQILKLNPLWLALTLAVPVGILIFDGMSIVANVKPFGVKMSLPKGVTIALMSRYFLNITPLGVGGQASQIMELSRFGLTPGQRIRVVAVRYISAQVVLALFTVIAFPLVRKTLPPIVTVSWVVGLLSYVAIPIGLLLFAFMPGLAEKCIGFAAWLLGKLHFIKQPQAWQKQIEKGVLDYVEGMRRVDAKGWIKLILLTIPQVLLTIALPWFVYQAFSLTGARPVEMILQCSVLTAAVAFVPTPGNAGAAEGAFFMLFQNHFPEALLTPAMLLWRLAGYYLIVLFGLGVTLYRNLAKRHRPEKNLTDG